MRTVWLRPTIADLEAALAYIRENNPTAAGATGARIIAAVEMLETAPAIGRPGRVNGTRELVVTGTPYIIPYRVKDGAIELLRVLHGRRRFS